MIRDFLTHLFCELTIGFVVALPLFTAYLMFFVPNDIPGNLS